MQVRVSAAVPIAVACLSALSLSAVPAFAANSISSATIQVTPTFQTAGVRVLVNGDDNANATGTVQYRVSGQTAWRPAHPLVRSSTTRLATLLFNLNEGTSYDVMVTLADPDGTVAPIVSTFTTRTTPKSYAFGRTLYMAPTGARNGTATGSLAAPFGTIADALTAAQPGDSIVMQPGIYRERLVDDFRSGTPDKPITIKGLPGAILEGTIPALEMPHAAPLWTPQSDGTWATQIAGQTCYVAAAGQRLYHYATRADLQTAMAAGQTGGAGWTLDTTTMTLYVRLAGGISPDTVAMEVGCMPEGLMFMNVHDIIVDGLEIAYFGDYDSMGVYLYQSSDMTVRNCHIHNVTGGVITKGVCVNNLIEKNDISDPPVDSWSWDIVKAHDPEGAGVSIMDGGSANVIRYNRIHNVNDGIVSETGTSDTAGDTDAYGNWIHDVVDDGLEPVLANINFRGWCNMVHVAMNASSVHMSSYGPIWLLYNVLSDFKQSGMKEGGYADATVLLYQNTMVTTVPAIDGLTPWTEMQNITARNNILMATQYAIQDYYTPAYGSTSFDNDLLFTTDPSRFVKWDNTRYATLTDLQAGTGQELHGINANPGFLGIAYGDYRLPSTSPARHKAVLISGINDFLGFTPDIGAYQMGQ